MSYKPYVSSNNLTPQQKVIIDQRNKADAKAKLESEKKKKEK